MRSSKISSSNQIIYESPETYGEHNHSLHIIFKLSIHGFITFITENISELIGYTKEELIGRHISFILHEEDIPETLNEWNCNNKNNVRILNVRLKKKNETYHKVEAIVTCMEESMNSKEFIFILKDIYENKKEESFILEGEKLKVAGQLAAGIAHEIKNPLTSIKGFIQLMKGGETFDNRYLEIIEDEIRRLEVISKELLVLAKPQQSEMKVHDISTIIEEVVILLEAEALKKSIIIQTETDQNNILIKCDIYKIKQVLINILKNGIEAMNSVGVITIIVETFPNEVHISIRDEGCGIPEELLKELGKPFYSTKETGNGLGLMMCCKIIEEHGGQLNVQSEKEIGTTFTIKLPLALT